MKQAARLAIYGLWVISNFAFIALVPSETARHFLSAYAAGSLAASLFSIPIYTSWRNKAFDLALAAVCALSIAAIGSDVSPLTYFMAAVGLTMADFAVAQTGKRSAMTFSRLAISMCTVLLIVDFDLAFCVRLAACAAAIGLSAKYKGYDSNALPTLVPHKWAITAITCGLYYAPLIAIPQITGQNAKIIYIAYAIVGNIVLRTQDFLIKEKIGSRHEVEIGSKRLYYVVCGVAVGLLVVFLAFLKPIYVAFVVPAIALVASIRIIDRISWL